jgi:O-antigen/teichoic acid export membrane protein
MENVLRRVQRGMQTLPVGSAANSLRQRVWRGAYWTIFGYGAGQLLRLVGNLIVTRLLFPELFGLMAVVNAILIGMVLLSDFGLGVSMIQNPRGDEPAFYNTVWTLQVARGVLLWLVSVPLALALAEFYAAPQMRVLIPVAASSVFLAGFNATSLFTLRRDLQIAILTKIDLGAQALGVLAMVVWAWLAPNVWALVAAGIVSAVVKLLASHFVQRGARNRLAWDATAARAIWAFGKWILLSSAILFFAEQSDRLTLAKVAPLEWLGVYAIALAFAEIPRQITSAIAGNVLFPAFATLQNLPRPALREKIVRNRMAVSYALALGVACSTAFSDFLVRVLYDPRYRQAMWMLPLLMLGLWPRLLCNTIEPVLLGIGKPQYTTAAQGARVAWTVLGVIAGYALAGIFGAVLAIVLNDVVYYLIINFGLQREGLSAMRQDARATLVFAATLAILAGARYALGWGFDTASLGVGF